MVWTYYNVVRTIYENNISLLFISCDRKKDIFIYFYSIFRHRIAIFQVLTEKTFSQSAINFSSLRDQY